MKKQPRHQEISNELLTEILAGKHDSARRLPSEAQLVKRFGVSRPTVARALLDLKIKGILDRNKLRQAAQAQTLQWVVIRPDAYLAGGGQSGPKWRSQVTALLSKAAGADA